MSRRAVVTTVEILLVLSIPALLLIPVGPILGLDFQHVDAFHDCHARDDPWSATGAECGDLLGGDMGYPPLLYWSFAWVRLLPFSVAYPVWAVAILAGTFLASLAWAPAGRRDVAVVLFATLLMLQYPLVFALERGNNDVLVVVLWTLAWMLFVSGRFAWSGVIIGLTAVLKLYPVFAALVVGGGFVWWAWRERAARPLLLRFAAGGVVAVGVVLILTFETTMSYFGGEGARLMAERHGLGPWTHTLYPIAPAGNAWLLSLPLLIAWVLAAARTLRDDPALVFAGGLAISTYFASVSNDYNLITAYPLLIVLFVRSLEAGANRLIVALLLLGLVAIVGNRWLFYWNEAAMGLRVFLQWLWLLSTGLVAATGRLRDTHLANAPVRPTFTGPGQTLRTYHDPEAG